MSHSPLQKITDMIGKNLRKILPEHYSYSLTVWRRLDDERVEIANASHGNPAEIVSILRDIADEVVEEERLAS